MEQPRIKKRVAVLDMYEGAANQGMRNLLQILEDYRFHVTYDIFDVRTQNELPDTSYDIYISTGGPGSPLEGNGIWDKRYFKLIDKLWAHNQQYNSRKKYVFFICHSFQMACKHFGLGELTKRRSTSFGIFPVHKTQYGVHDPIFETLPDPFWAVDSREWQVVQPNLDRFENFGAQLLALEKIRDHVDYERAIMAVRFSEEFFGTQFHPEADAQGMISYMKEPERRKQIISIHGEAKYNLMLGHLRDADKITLTHNTIIPRFLEMACYALQEA